MRLVQPEYLYLLLLLPIFWGLELYLIYWRQRSRACFAEGKFHFMIFPAYAHGRRWLKLVIWSLAFCALILALGRPQGRPILREQIEKTMVYYMILDCSLSMRAQDVKPSRLAAARDAMRCLIEHLPQDRIGLIAFAGEARVLCPATFDHQSLCNALLSVKARFPGKAGSNPAAGVKLAMQKMDVLPGQSRVIVLFSDGEDNQSGNLAELGTLAAQQGIKIISLGFGTAKGGVIPLGKDFWGQRQYRRYHGKLVRSCLVSLDLRKAAKLSRGHYFYWENSWQTSKSVLKVLKQYSRDIVKQGKILAYFEYFPWLAGIAFCLLLLDWIIPVTRRRQL